MACDLVEKPGWKINAWSRSRLGLLVRAEPAQLPGLVRDGLVVQPFAIVLDGDDQGVPLALGLERDAAGWRACRPDCGRRGFDPVPHRVAYHVQERLERLVLDRTVHARLLADHDDLDLPSFDPRRIVQHARQTLEQAADRHDPERLERIPDLERDADQGITAVGHRGRGGPSRFGQDGQVVWPAPPGGGADRAGPPRDRPTARRLRPFCPRPTSCSRSRLTEQAVAAVLHRRRERLHRLGLREPESALHDQLGSQVGQLVKPRRRNADRAFRGPVDSVGS